MKKIVFLILFIGIGPFMVWENANILSEFKLRNENLSVANIPTADRKCSSTAFLFHQCSFNYVIEGEKIYKNYRFLAFGSPDTVRLLVSDKTGTITSTVAQSYFWNRIFTVIVTMLISIFTLLAILPSRRRVNESPRLDLENKIKTDIQSSEAPLQGNAPIFGKR